MVLLSSSLNPGNSHSETKPELPKDTITALSSQPHSLNSKKSFSPNPYQLWPLLPPRPESLRELRYGSCSLSSHRAHLRPHWGHIQMTPGLLFLYLTRGPCYQGLFPFVLYSFGFHDTFCWNFFFFLNIPGGSCLLSFCLSLVLRFLQPMDPVGCDLSYSLKPMAAPCVSSVLFRVPGACNWF